MPECESQSFVLLILGIIVPMILGVNSSIKKPECETIRSFCGTCETVHEYIRSDSPQFNKQYAKREDLEKAIATDIETIKEFKHDHENKDIPEEMREFIGCAVCGAADSIVLRVRTHGLED